jgi:hypothetical protein
MAMDPVQEMVVRAAAPALIATSIQAQNAADLAMFYAANPDALKHREKIEQKIQESLARNVVVGREDVWRWYRGANLKTFVDEEITRRDGERERARMAETVGSGSSPRTVVGVGGKDPYMLDDKDLQSAADVAPF